MEIIMENNFQNDDSYYVAKKRVEEIKGFYGNLIAYILVNVGLLAINLLTSPEYLWFFWPLLGWGIGVAVHGMVVYRWLPFFGKNWEDQKIKEFMGEEKRKSDNWE